MEEKLVSKWQNLPFLGNPAKWYQYPNRGGTGTHMQRQNGIGTNKSGTGTTTSCSPDFWCSYIVKLKFTSME